MEYIASDLIFWCWATEKFPIETFVPSYAHFEKQTGPVGR